MHVTREYLKKHPNEVFVFGDNTIRKGHGGAAVLRDEPNTWGFITKIYPSLRDSAYYTVSEYRCVFKAELARLKYEIENNPEKIYLISKLGAGLANKYGIFEKIIEPQIKIELQNYSNVQFLF